MSRLRILPVNINPQVDALTNMESLTPRWSFHFADVNYPSGLSIYGGWGSAWADYDGDGDLDAFVATSGNPVCCESSVI